MPELDYIEGLQPWRQFPHRLITWWDMLSFSAWNFFWCGQALQKIEQDCLLGSMIVPGDEPVFALPKPIDDAAKAKAIKSLSRIAEEFESIGLRISAQTALEVVTELQGSKRALAVNFQWLMDKVKDISSLSRKEIKGSAFFYVPSEKAKFYPRVRDPHIFGAAVGSAFPSAMLDIAEAGICVALDRGSACVFHLMRALEIGLIALGTKFDVSMAHTNWAPAIEEIERKIRDMHKDPAWKAFPDCKEQQEFYAQAASHFGILKDAWRNYTMHIRGFYTEEQAERIFENVKGFMQKLAERLSE